MHDLHHTSVRSGGVNNMHNLHLTSLRSGGVNIMHDLHHTNYDCYLHIVVSAKRTRPI